jgi:hypothetical protein
MWVVTSLQMVCEGSSLEDGATLGDFYVGNLSTIRVSLLSASKESQGKERGGGSVTSSGPASMYDSVALSPLAASSAPMLSPSAVVASAPAAQDETVITEEEGKRAIIVTGIPAADPTRTEVALVEAFSKFGVLARVIFQDERNAPAEGGASPVHQRAVVLFEQESDALAAVNSDVPVMVLGRVPESIIPASALQLPNAGSAAGSAMQHNALRGPSQAVAHMLAQGFLYGHQGVAHVKAFDDTHGMSQRIRVALDTITSKAGELNDRYHIAQTVRSTYEAVRLTQHLLLLQSLSAYICSHLAGCGSSGRSRSRIAHFCATDAGFAICSRSCIGVGGSSHAKSNHRLDSCECSRCVEPSGCISARYVSASTCGS